MLPRPFARRLQGNVNSRIRNESPQAALPRAFLDFSIQYADDAKCFCDQRVASGVRRNVRFQRQTEKTRRLFVRALLFCRLLRRISRLVRSSEKLDRFSDRVGGLFKNETAPEGIFNDGAM